MSRRRKKKVVEEAPQVDVAPAEETKETQMMSEMRIIQKYKDRIASPLTAIRAHCVECMGGAIQEVARCTAPGCSLYSLRMGKNAFDKRVLKRQEAEA